MQLIECWANISGNLIAKGAQVLPKDVELVMTSKGNRITDNLENLAVSVTQILNVYFGINYDNISRELVGEITANLVNRFNGLTFDDLRNSFTRKPITKIKGVGMTVGEFLTPVDEYFVIKQRVNNEIQESERKQRERELKEALDLAQYKREQENQLTIFKDLAKKGAIEWTGTENEALMISAIVSKELISKEEKIAIFKQVIDFEKAKRKAERKKTDEYFELMEFDNSTFTIRAKCALIVVNRVLEMLAMEC